MANMKDLLGEMTLEEFEAKGESIFAETKTVCENSFVKSYSKEARRLYNIWLKDQGTELLKNTIAKYDRDMLEENIDMLVQFMMENFIIWLEETV